MASYYCSSILFKKSTKSPRIFFETIDFIPQTLIRIPIIAKPCDLVKNMKPNNIPFRERYETIDF